MPGASFVGLDLSLNGTGVAVIRYDGERWLPPILHTISLSHTGPVTKTYEARRLVTVINRLFECGVFDPQIVKLAAIEDYAYGKALGVLGEDGRVHATSSCVFNLGELGGCVRYHLLTTGVPFINVPIQHGKKFATGSGASKKDAVAARMSALWNIPTFRKNQYDSSDALSLATLAAFKHLGELSAMTNYRYWGPLVNDLEVVR